MNKELHLTPVETIIREDGTVYAVVDIFEDIEIRIKIISDYVSNINYFYLRCK